MTYIQRSDLADRPTADDKLESSSETFKGTYTLRQGEYQDLRTRDDADSKTFWCFMDQAGTPSYTHKIMEEFKLVERRLGERTKGNSVDVRPPLEWFVMASRTPGVFSFGGDLRHFAARIQSGDYDAIRRYGHAAVTAVHRNNIAFGLPLVTIALVQGDALGGGFEHALSFDMIVAERGSKFGLPESLFNMFPGMGAYSFLSRRVNRKLTESLIMSGEVHTAEEMHEMGIVDILADVGMGEQTVRDFIARTGRKHNALYATMQARRRVDPVTFEELIGVVDIWADAAMRLTAADLRRMTLLISAQDRRMAAARKIKTIVPE